MRDFSRVIAALVIALIAPPHAAGGKDGKPAEVGQPAPPIIAYGPDGNVAVPAHLKGKTILLVFWWTQALKNAAFKTQFDELKAIRRAYAHREQFLIVSLCVDVYTTDQGPRAWDRFVLGQGSVDYGDGKRRFIDDSKWWQCIEVPVEEPSSRRYAVDRDATAFLIGPDGRLIAAHVRTEMLRGEVAKLLDGARRP